MQLSNKQTESKIPHILHYIYLGGFDAYIAETERPRATLHTWYRETCLKVHKHWEIMFWTEQMAEDLIVNHYNWFLPIWRTYDMEVGVYLPATLQYPEGKAGLSSKHPVTSCLTRSS